jgi:polysaccharide export outer membrane protein
MSKSTICRSALVPLGLLGLAGCSTFSSSGPSASKVAKQAVRLETLSPEAAAAMWRQKADAEEQQVHGVLAQLGQRQANVDVRLYPGSKLDVALWTQPVADGTSAGVGAVAKADLGSFTVANDGTLSLPYVGTIAMSGETLLDAQKVLARQFAATRRFQAPQVSLTMQDNPHQQIIVAGATNRPAPLAWRDGGITLAEAITQGGGSLLVEQGQMQDQLLSANHVNVIRDGATYELPVKVALGSEVPLRPDDQVILEHQPLVRVQCLGGGWAQNTVQSFDDTPSLSKVVASGGGLNVQAAQGAAVFVLSADRSVIYRFPWNSLAGLQAAQAFPVGNGDIIYIAPAPIIKIQQVANILFSAAYPVATAKGL